MSKLNVKQIQDEVRSLLELHKGGIRWSEILKKIHDKHPETPLNTIHGATHVLLSKDKDSIVKAARGTYVLAKFFETPSPADRAPPHDSKDTSVDAAGGKLFEVDFYKPFAEWLREELDEVNVVETLGGNVFKSKWGTPDVFGVLKPLPGELLEFERQVVSAEIKLDPQQPIVAFGQAMAYRLFSHRSYVVLPNTIGEEDRGRLDALAMIYGLGFATFSLDKENPDFSLRVRATLRQPDMFYVNQVARRILDYSEDIFQRLFR